MNARELQIVAFEAQFETASKQILEAAGLGETFLSPNREGIEDKLPDSRVEVLFTTGDEAERTLNDAGEEVPSAWTGVLEVSIHTKAEDNSPSAVALVGSVHQEFAARARLAFLLKEGPFTADNLPDYSISNIRQLRGTRAPDPRFFEHRTVLRFEISFDILDGAWTQPVR